MQVDKSPSIAALHPRSQAEAQHMEQELQAASIRVAALESQVALLTEQLDQSRQASVALTSRLSGAVNTQREVCVAS